MSRTMAQKQRISKEFGDKEFDRAMADFLRKDKKLLEKLAKV